MTTRPIEIDSLGMFMIHLGWTKFLEHQLYSLEEFLEKIEENSKKTGTSGNALVIRSPRHLMQWSGLWIREHYRKIRVQGEFTDATGNIVMSEDVTIRARSIPASMLISLGERINSGVPTTLSDIFDMEGIPPLKALKAFNKKECLQIRMETEFTPWDEFKKKLQTISV